jgi:peptide/nickel transport system permease protein
MDKVQFTKILILSWIKSLTAHTLTLTGILIVSFCLLRVIPGDPALALLKSSADPSSLDTARELERIRRRIGTNRPIFYFEIQPWTATQSSISDYLPKPVWHGADNQFHDWFIGLFGFHLGHSYKDGQPVSRMLVSAWEVTGTIAFGSVFLGMTSGWFLGLGLAHTRQYALKQITKTILLIGYAIPSFLLAGLLLAAVQNISLMKWLPTSGLISIGYQSNWSLCERILDYLRHLLLPLICYLVPITFFTARLVVRQVDLESGSIHLLTAYSLGSKQADVIRIWLSGLVRLPVWASCASVTASALGGSVIVESIFSLPGIGRLSYHAALERNYPVLMGVVVSTACIVQLVYIVSDNQTKRLDPRLEQT